MGGRAYRAGLACLIMPGWVVLGPQCLKENHLQTSTSSQTLSFRRVQVSLAHRHLSLGGGGARYSEDTLAHPTRLVQGSLRLGVVLC